VTRYQPVISRRAEMDLAHQYRWYSDTASAGVAERYLTAFDATVASLLTAPDTGKACRFRSPELVGMRWRAIHAPFSAHLLFYRIHGAELSIERVMHGARDLPRRLIEPPEDEHASEAKDS
jgi:plasmid stabilization system protein ParE